MPDPAAPEPFVSVILPTYNRAASLGRAIESVLAQDPPPDELIVVDDGSEEDLSPVLGRYAGRIVVIRQANAGVASARNAGARVARGRWLAFNDSDDEWLPGHMAVLYRDLAAADPDVVVHLGDVRLKGRSYDVSQLGNLGFVFPEDRAERVERPLRLIILGMTLQGAAVRRDVFERIGGFEPTMRNGQDTHLFARLVGEGPFLVTGATLAILHRLDDDPHALTGYARRDPVSYRTFVLRTLEPCDSIDLSPEDRHLVAIVRHLWLLHLARAEAETGQPRPWATLARAARSHPVPLKGWVKAAVLGLAGPRGYALFLHTAPPRIDRSV
jgi:glycosyltransferase involved in cell wall biosynthesis